MLAVPTFADTVKQYVLVKVGYPVYVNGQEYTSGEQPILNYQGNTYVPMRSVGDILGADVRWNSELNRSEITYGGGMPHANNAFRHIQVTGSNGHYTVTGEARVFEAVMNYVVSAQNNDLAESTYMLNEGAPTWSPFSLSIVIPADQLPLSGTLKIELFEYSAKDGSRINVMPLVLETFTPRVNN
ncbi:hypothetical protein H8B09_06285 [Paenibacillus sp. PR3]|uniref:Copper amine oxidase-like N-terminal domain-containing protein n=1 Tax=Paenibacillus terricola TaxID=2763503 RepID=A0ABR8MQU2_9BACL|nr:Gmad2 immunoglobulin-like domain-containing protein [Paenibacillus terricola]MBD3918357.1 hypothetical protein [Paenibacillus terricola]